MTQHTTYNIPDQSGTSFRVDLNFYLKAILSNNSGSTEPNKPLIGMLWYDTNNHLLKVRNSTNTAWTIIANSVTGEVNSVVNTENTTSVEGFTADIEPTPNTIVHRGTSTIPGGLTPAIKTNVIGNAPSGNAETIGGFSNTYLKNIQNTSDRDYITVTAGDYLFTGGRVTQFTIFSPAVNWQDYKIPFSGTYRLRAWVRSPASSGTTTSGIKLSVGNTILRIYNKAGTAAEPSGLTPLVSNGHFTIYELDTEFLTAGTVLSAELLGNSGTYDWSLGTNEYGFQMIPNTGKTLADLIFGMGVGSQLSVL